MSLSKLFIKLLKFKFNLKKKIKKELRSFGATREKLSLPAQSLKPGTK